MTEDEARQRTFAMPLTSPAYPRGPYRFVNPEYFILTYRSDPAVIEKIIPRPFKLHEPLVKFEFMKMPDSTGFGDYCESSEVIPVSFQGEVGGYQHAMYLNDHAPIAGGRFLMWTVHRRTASAGCSAPLFTARWRIAATSHRCAG